MCILWAISIGLTVVISNFELERCKYKINSAFLISGHAHLRSIYIHLYDAYMLCFLICMAKEIKFITYCRERRHKIY